MFLFGQTSLGFYHVQELFGIDADNNVHTTPAEIEDASAQGNEVANTDQIDTSMRELDVALFLFGRSETSP